MIYKCFYNTLFSQVSGMWDLDYFSVIFFFIAFINFDESPSLLAFEGSLYPLDTALNRFVFIFVCLGYI